MNYKSVLLLLVAGSNFALSFFIFFKDRRNKVNIWFSLMLFFIFLWSIFLAFFYLTNSVDQLYIWTKPIWISAAIIATCFFYFVNYFPFPSRKISNLIHLLHFFSIVIISLMVYFFGIEDYIDKYPEIYQVHVNFFNLSIFASYFCLTIIWSFIILFKKMRSASSYTLRITRIVFWTTFMSAVFGSFFNLFLYFINTDFAWLGPSFTMIMVFIIVRQVFIKEEK